MKNDEVYKQLQVYVYLCIFLYIMCNKTYVAASKCSKNLLVYFTEIATVNKEIYSDILCCLMDVVRRKHPKKWRNQSLFLLHDNVPAHRLVFV